MGTVCLRWRRDGDSTSADSDVVTKYRLGDIKVESPPLVVKLDCPPHAVLGNPFITLLGFRIGRICFRRSSSCWQILRVSCYLGPTMIGFSFCLGLSILSVTRSFHWPQVLNFFPELPWPLWDIQLGFNPRLLHPPFSCFPPSLILRWQMREWGQSLLQPSENFYSPVNSAWISC